MPDYEEYKIERVEGVNDDPLPPNHDDNGKGCNGAYFVLKFNDLVDLVSTLPTELMPLDPLAVKIAYESLIDTNEFSDSEKLKLATIENRANHTGTQFSNTISDWNLRLAGTENITAYNPTLEYHPATKKYVDDLLLDSGVVNVNADWTATEGQAAILNKPTFGSAAFAEISSFATAIQGIRADSALQPSALTEYETSTELDARDIDNRDRANHTGTQTHDTISDWSDRLAGTNNIIAYTPTGSYHPTTKEYVDNNLSAGLTSARARANHTGTQIHNTISDWSSTLAGTENTTEYIPTELYHPATKKYVDDNLTTYTDLEAQDAIGLILSPEFTYDDLTPLISISSLSADKITEGTTNKLFTQADRTKLDSISESAQANVNADWIATEGDSLILNKPVLGSAAYADTTTFATAAQGDLADTSLQPDDILSYETTAELDLRDIDNRDRANHSGTQSYTTISDWTTNLAGTNNTEVYTPTGLYHPATKQYVDEAIAGVSVAGGGYTDEEAQDAVGIILSTEFIYDDNTPSISIQSLNADKLVEGVDNKLFTATDRTKLDGISAGAEVNVNADWEATTGDALILNRPDLSLKANIDSPIFTGIPTAPTAVGGTNTTQIATTAFVQTAVSAATPTLDADLTAIAALSGTSGLLRKTAADTWSLDTSSYETTTQLDDRDTANRSRENHTGTQLSSTISDWTTRLAGTANTAAYTPTGDYHPATKKYVDDSIYGEVYPSVTALANGTVNTSLGSHFSITVSSNITFSFTNPRPSGTVTSITIQVTHTSGTLTWPTSVKWPNGVAPSLTTSRIHDFSFVSYDGGTTWKGFAITNYI